MPRLSRFVLTDDPAWFCNLHRHKTEAELLYIEKGQTVYTIDDVSYVANEGDMVLIEAGCLHALAPANNAPCVTWTCAVRDFKFKGLGSLKVAHSGMYPVMPAGSYRKVLENIFRTINSLRLMNTDAALFACHSLAAVVTVMFHEKFQSSSIQLKTRKKSVLVKDVLEYLDDHYAEKISLQQLCQKFHASESYISHAFAKEYKVSPIHYVVARRINEAKFLLANTKNNLSVISHQVGYEHKSYFIKLFTKHVGYTPSEYRRKYAAEASPMFEKLHS